MTVVIPTRNRWSILLGAALPAALGQEGVDHEVVVVDDGSTDETSDRIAAIGEQRLRVVRHDRSLGVGRARNAGIDAAQGAWIAFLDDDMIGAGGTRAQGSRARHPFAIRGASRT